MGLSMGETLSLWQAGLIIVPQERADALAPEEDCRVMLLHCVDADYDGPLG